MSTFIDELKRRNVIRVGVAYLALAWLILQVAEMLLPVYGFTDAAIRNLVVILAVGMLITLGLAWAFEWTPRGILKDSDAEASTEGVGQDHKRFDRFVIFVLVVAVAFFGIDKFVLDPARDAEKIEAATEQGRAEALLAKENDKSVAVLPFANRSTQEDDVYFVDGIHDDILTQLARIGALAVTSRTSVERYRGTALSIKEIGAELGVRAILEGGVQRAGDRVRINVQLIDAASDDHLWAETYVRELTAANIFSVQGDIASAVAEALRAALLPEEQLALQETPTESIQAYDLYLLGRYHWRKRTKESIDIARGHFEQAIEQDPNYVLALSGLADSYTMLVIHGNMTGEEAHPLAQQAIDQAMAIDDSVSEVWSSLGFLRREQAQLGESEEAFKRALELDDKNFSAWLWYADLLSRNRRDLEAVDALERAYELEPMSFVVNDQLARQFDLTGEYDRAIQHYDRADQLDDKDTSGYKLEIAWSQYWAGDYARSIYSHRNILHDEPDSGSAMYGLASIYIAMGNFREAKVWIDRIGAVTSLFRPGDALLMAQQDYAGAIVYLEESLRLRAPRRNQGLLFRLFQAHRHNGDIDTARTYLAEYIDDRGGRVEVNPRHFRRWNELDIAAFWLAHSDAGSAESERGLEIAREVQENLTEMINMGWHVPDMFVLLAAAEVLLGNSDTAVAQINEAIDLGHKNQSRLLANPVFDSIRDTSAFEDALARMQSLIAEEEANLANFELMPYAPPAEREPIAVARGTLQNYEGWYSDGNIMVQVLFMQGGQFGAAFGPSPPFPLLAQSEDEFYTPVSTDFTVKFGADESGAITHFLFKSAYDDRRMKRVDAPPPAIQLPREVLARYEGTFAYDRLSGLEGERAEVDLWVAEIYVDEAGKVWIDYDNQPEVEITAFSESEFQAVGYQSQYRFIADPDTGEFNEFIRLRDGAEYRFFRQQAAN